MLLSAITQLHVLYHSERQTRITYSHLQWLETCCNYQAMSVCARLALRGDCRTKGHCDVYCFHIFSTTKRFLLAERSYSVDWGVVVHIKMQQFKASATDNEGCVFVNCLFYVLRREI